MLTYWKYDVPIGVFELQMPAHSQITNVELQAGVPRLWALVNPENPMTTRFFQVHGTGHMLREFGDDWHSRHVATFQQPPFVWHLVERVYHAV